MTRYVVVMMQRVWEEATVYVDAAGESEAEEKARALTNAGKVEWSFLEADDSVEVVTVNKQPSA